LIIDDRQQTPLDAKAAAAAALPPGAHITTAVVQP